jgi:hypothetical protein
MSHPSDTTSVSNYDDVLLEVQPFLESLADILSRLLGTLDDSDKYGHNEVSVNEQVSMEEA